MFKNNLEEFEKIPKTSGLYYFYDENDTLLYVGKAVNLYKRILEHHHSHLDHKEGMFFRKILLSKGLLDKDRNEWPKELVKSLRDFEVRALSKRPLIVIDQIFNRVKIIAVEEIPNEFIKSKEKEMILKLKPPFNSQTASNEYYRLAEEPE